MSVNPEPAETELLYFESVLSLLSVPSFELGGISQCFEHQQRFFSSA